MRRLRLFLPLIAASLTLASTVGSGPYPTLVQQGFLDAFNRGIFQTLVKLPPPADVKSLGSPGLVQEFTSAANSSQSGALVMPGPTNPAATFQVYPGIYAFYSSVGVGTAGYPTMDTASCPANTYGTCTYQLFSQNYALFVYSTVAGNYAVADPVYTEWSAGGGIAGSLGAATGSSTSVTSKVGTAGLSQNFAGGAIYAFPANSGTPSVYTVSGSIYTAFVGAGGPAALGFPKSGEIALVTGMHQQIFENGRIAWTPGSLPSVLFPVQQVELLANSSSFVSPVITLPLGSTSILTAQVFDTLGNSVTGRTLNWSTSNGSAVTVQSNGYTAVIKAAGAGSANITATSEGVVSNIIPIQVPSQCCAIGEGAPGPNITLAFQTAAARNQLSVALPNSTPVTRLGNGYVQTLTGNGTGTIYVIAEADQSAVAWVITAALYTAYLADGGFSGPLGYPASDASVAGTQSFINGAALAGSPVRLVPAPLAAKWIASGAETGPLGEPAGNSTPFTSGSGFNGYVQAFAGGSIFGITSGSRAGQAYSSSGSILTAYMALSGPAGTLGVPIGDIFTNGGGLQQNFETGSLVLQTGASAAVVNYYPRTPAVSVTPAIVAPGGTVHVAVSGFAFGASLAVSASSQSVFTVAAPLGQFAWDIAIPGSAAPGLVTIQAKAGNSSDAAVGSYTIVPVAQLRPNLTVVSGDQQTGAPGALLAGPLVARLTDTNGNPLPGVQVSWSALPGAAVSGPAVTDANGLINARLRLPLAQGATAASIAAAGQVVTFSALSAAKTISEFPSFTQVDGQSGFIAAMAAVLRHYQNAGAAGAPNGLATPTSVGQYFSANGGITASETGGPIANPWTAMRFAGVAGGLSVEAATLDRIRDLLSGGTPFVLELSVAVDGSPAGGATVDAFGVNADGSIAIMDPNPAFGRTSLMDYLNGFGIQGHTVQASVSGVLRIVPTAMAPAGFVAASQLAAAASATSATGACTNSIDIADQTAAGQTAAVKVGGVRFIECEGTQSVYQLGFETNRGATVFDLAGAPPQQIPAGSVAAYQIARQSGSLSIVPQNIAISGVVDSAGLGSALSPGGLFSIFGQGFTAGANTSTVTVSGQTATVLSETPFQINAQMPTGLTEGNAILQLDGPMGSISQTVALSTTGPGIFVIGTSADGQGLGAVENQDGTINSAANPSQRGQYISIYCTGLGATTPQGPLQIAAAQITVSAGGGSTIKPSFAGLTPGIPGLYQVNVQIPAGTAPGSELALSISAGGESSNTVVFAVQ